MQAYQTTEFKYCLSLLNTLKKQRLDISVYEKVYQKPFGNRATYELLNLFLMYYRKKNNNKIFRIKVYNSTKINI